MADKSGQHFLVYNADTARSGFVTGRDAWALRELVKAGESGCTPIDTPGPRWSSYVHNLRHEHGLIVETITQRHGGPFPGNHARYVLRSNVRLVSNMEVA